MSKTKLIDNAVSLWDGTQFIPYKACIDIEDEDQVRDTLIGHEDESDEDYGLGVVSSNHVNDQDLDAGMQGDDILTVEDDADTTLHKNIWYKVKYFWLNLVLLTFAWQPNTISKSHWNGEERRITLTGWQIRSGLIFSVSSLNCFVTQILWICW